MSPTTKAGVRVARKDLTALENDAPEHDLNWLDATWRRNVRRRLLDWYSRNARELPWRSEPTPYRVWVSEIMLQQTQVATVIDYFNRFVERFPTVQDLADADQEELLSFWEGLGYYRRARSLHAAAKQIVALHDGCFPTEYEDVLALPGVGRYTAGAILSISGDAKLPILEGNTQRLFSRWIALRAPVTERSSSNLLWRVAESMLPRKEAGTFNQAAMELGALVCTPKNPDCGQCPVRRYCATFREGLQEEIPGKISKVKYEDRVEYALVVRKTAPRSSVAKYLVRVLPDGGRWAGLWDFPRTTERTFETAREAADEISRDLGIPIRPGKRLTTIRHAVTRFRIRLHVHEADLEELRKGPTRPWRFVTLSEMQKLPMSVTGRQIAEQLKARSD